MSSCVLLSVSGGGSRALEWLSEGVKGRMERDAVRRDSESCRACGPAVLRVCQGGRPCVRRPQGLAVSTRCREACHLEGKCSLHKRELGLESRVLPVGALHSFHLKGGS